MRSTRRRPWSAAAPDSPVFDAPQAALTFEGTPRVPTPPRQPRKRGRVKAEAQPSLPQAGRLDAPERGGTILLMGRRLMPMQALWNSQEQLSLAFRVLTLGSILSTAVFGFLLYRINDRISQLQQDESSRQSGLIGKQQKLIDRQESRLTDQHMRLGEVNEQLAASITKSDALVRTSIEVQDRLENVSNANASLVRRSDELSQKAIAAERGVATTYDFNGALRNRTAGRESVVVEGETSAAFEKLITLQTQNAWKELASEAAQVAGKYPTWLTPRLFAGIADANLGRFAAAKANLEFVSRQSGSDPQYADASRILAQIKAAGH